MTKRDNIVKKNFLYNAVGSTVNASISLIFMIIVTRINGTDKAGIFTFAFSTSCLLQVIGLFAGRAYQVTETNKNYKTKQEYYKLFNEIRNNNNFEDWILYILKGIEITSKETIDLIEKIQNEMKNYKEEFRSKLPKIYSKELLESLFYEVYTKISYIEKTCNVTRITATSYLNQLEEIGLLESEKIGREKIYKNVRLIKLLSDM